MKIYYVRWSDGSAAGTVDTGYTRTDRDDAESDRDAAEQEEKDHPSRPGKDVTFTVEEMESE
jgi:hypothetical protein